MTDTDQPTTLGSGTVAALESAWADIHAVHPDVEADVVFRIGSGRAGRRGSLVLGSMTVDAVWEDHRSVKSRAKSDPDRYRCIFIAGETLARHPVELMETLIHEAAHTVAVTRGIKDVSRQNRYHNRKFREICEEMGLSWEHLAYQTRKGDDGEQILLDNPEFDKAEPADIRKNPKYLTKPAPADEIIGFSDMTITKATAKVFADTIQNLDKNVSVQLGAGGGSLKGAPKPRRTVVVHKVAHGDGLQDVETAIAQLDFELDDPDELRGDPQRLGVVVYEGLVERKLLAPHVAWIEEV